MLNIINNFRAHFSKKAEQHFGGVPLSNLTNLAKLADCRNYCTIDEHSLLVLHHFDMCGLGDRCATQFTLDENLKLVILNGIPYTEKGYLSQTGRFAKMVNSSLVFTCHNR